MKLEERLINVPPPKEMEMTIHPAVLATTQLSASKIMEDEPGARMQFALFAADPSYQVSTPVMDAMKRLGLADGAGTVHEDTRQALGVAAASLGAG